MLPGYSVRTHLGTRAVPTEWNTVHTHVSTQVRLWCADTDEPVVNSWASNDGTPAPPIECALRGNRTSAQMQVGLMPQPQRQWQQQPACCSSGGGGGGTSSSSSPSSSTITTTTDIVAVVVTAAVVIGSRCCRTTTMPEPNHGHSQSNATMVHRTAPRT